MKHLIPAFVFALGVAFYAPAVHADCGHCGSEAKAHTHEPGEKHEAAECGDCDKDKAACDCKKSPEDLCKCGEPKSECTCDKK